MSFTGNKRNFPGQQSVTPRLRPTMFPQVDSDDSNSNDEMSDPFKVRGQRSSRDHGSNTTTGHVLTDLRSVSFHPQEGHQDDDEPRRNINYFHGPSINFFPCPGSLVQSHIVFGSVPEPPEPSSSSQQQNGGTSSCDHGGMIWQPVVNTNRTREQVAGTNPDSSGNMRQPSAPNCSPYPDIPPRDYKY